jgi:hypothetical protein
MFDRRQKLLATSRGTVPHLRDDGSCSTPKEVPDALHSPLLNIHEYTSEAEKAYMLICWRNSARVIGGSVPIFGGENAIA